MNAPQIIMAGLMALGLEAAAARAAAAPDKEKLAEYGKAIQAVNMGNIQTEAGQLAAARVNTALAAFLNVVRTEYKALGK